MNEKRIPSMALAKCERQFSMGAVLKPRANRGAHPRSTQASFRTHRGTAWTATAAACSTACASLVPLWAPSTSRCP